MVIRYPGGKSKLKDPILLALNTLFNQYPSYEYREPFFGGGSIGFEIIEKQKNIWINDKDPGMSALWTVIHHYKDELINKINTYSPNVADFYVFKEELNNSNIEDLVDLAFKKLVIHQTSYSGLGVKSGGPLGGANQKSKYKIDCRWSPKTLIKNINEANNLFNSCFVRYGSCSCLDFEEIISYKKQKAIIYLDPPYYKVGNDLYQYGFSQQDHVRLAKVLKETEHEWVLSYDDCDEIRKLYDWADIKTISMKSTINTKSGSHEKLELLIGKK